MNESKFAWRSLALAGHESTTRDDRVVRLRLSLSYAELAASEPQPDLSARLDTLARRASCEYVAASTFEELLDGKDALVQFVRADVALAARSLGVVVGRTTVRELGLALAAAC